MIDNDPSLVAGLNFRREMFRPTKENWCGNFAIAGDARWPRPNLVCVQFLKMSTGQWRVCVWGNDDIGMEKDFPSDKFMLAQLTYMELAVAEAISQQHLIEMGFEFA